MRNQISLIPALLVRLRIVKCALREWDFEARVYFNRHYLRAKAEIVKMVHLTAQLSLSLPALSLSLSVQSQISDNTTRCAGRGGKVVNTASLCGQANITCLLTYCKLFAVKLILAATADIVATSLLLQVTEASKGMRMFCCSISLLM